MRSQPELSCMSRSVMQPVYDTKKPATTRKTTSNSGVSCMSCTFDPDCHNTGHSGFSGKVHDMHDTCLFGVSFPITTRKTVSCTRCMTAHDMHDSRRGGIAA